MAMTVSSRPTIVVFDETQVMLDSITKMLGKHYHVVGVINFSTLLKAITNYNPSLFLLDTELSKPSFYWPANTEIASGFDMARQIRKIPRFAGTQILFMTATAEAETITNAVKSGGGDIIIKPPNKDALLEKIHCLLSPVTITIEQGENR